MMAAAAVVGCKWGDLVDDENEIEILEETKSLYFIYIYIYIGSPSGRTSGFRGASGRTSDPSECMTPHPTKPCSLLAQKQYDSF